MTKTAYPVLLLSIFFMTGKARPQSVKNNPPVVIFVASTPCSNGTRPVPGISRQDSCELIKWELRFSEDIEVKTSGTYQLDCIYGMPKQGTRGFINGGKHLHRKGRWIRTKGTKMNPEAIVYRLDPDKPSESISFVRLNKSVLHLLDREGQLMIGTGAWSYTLSKK